MNINRNIKIIFWVIFGIFAALIVYIIWFALAEAPRVINNPYNLRLTAEENAVKRGNIEDENGIVIAESALGDEGYERVYNYPKMYCHITGYTDMGKTGIESACNAELLTLHNATLQKFLYILTNKVFKKGKFSLTGKNPFSQPAYALDAFVAGDDDLASGEAVVPEGESSEETETEETSAETTSEAAIYEDSDIDSEIKDIYNKIPEGGNVDIGSLLPDDYKAEYDFFAPLKNGYVLTGNTVVLTIDHRIQQKAYELLDGKKGSIVVSDVNTGAIKAMVSYPNYDPSAIEENWDYLTTDTENTPLLNRAAQGLYPPGSVFKIGMAQLIIDNGYSDLTYNCNGINYFGNKALRCYNTYAHGAEGLTDAFKNSCNGYFANAALKLGANAIVSQALNLGYNKDYNYPLEHTESIFSLSTDANNTEIVDTSIGQGKTMVTPLHINMITSAVANGGTMYTPQIIKGTKSRSGRTLSKTQPEAINTIMTQTTAAAIRSLMRQVVLEGTGTAANSSIVDIAGKTGTAENGTENDHSWFTCFAPYDSPKYAVTVMLEYSGHSGRTTTIAKELLEYINTL